MKFLLLLYDDEDVWVAIHDSERNQIGEEYIAPTAEDSFPAEARTA